MIGRFSGPAERRPALVLGHFDTVWPAGTLERMPFRVDENGRAYGPGVFDMKASLVIFIAVMERAPKTRARLAEARLGALHVGRGDRQPHVARVDREAGG